MLLVNEHLNTEEYMAIWQLCMLAVLLWVYVVLGGSRLRETVGHVCRFMTRVQCSVLLLLSCSCPQEVRGEGIPASGCRLRAIGFVVATTWVRWLVD